MQVYIIIDVFRAFTTAAYILEQNPKSYLLTNKSSVISKLAKKLSGNIRVGKPEIGASLKYDIPNSPTRAKELKIENNHILHRTEAGANGILKSKDADVIFAASFVNANATIELIKNLNNPEIKIVPMGHESVTPSLEDDLCALYFEKLMKNEKIEIDSYLQDIKNGPGKYFFTEDQWQYPEKDFERCLKIDHFNFAIKATINNDHAILTKCHKLS